MLTTALFDFHDFRSCLMKPVQPSFKPKGQFLMSLWGQGQVKQKAIQHRRRKDAEKDKPGAK